ncbi:hypothetical protein [Geodermatophilus sp. SYSU D00710]
MTWSTVQFVQGPGEVIHRMTAFSGMTVFDVVGAGPEVGSGGVIVYFHEVLPGPVHRVGLRVTGSPVTVRIKGGLA